MANKVKGKRRLRRSLKAMNKSKLAKEWLIFWKMHEK